MSLTAGVFDEIADGLVHGQLRSGQVSAVVPDSTAPRSDCLAAQFVWPVELTHRGHCIGHEGDTRRTFRAPREIDRYRIDVNSVDDDSRDKIRIAEGKADQIWRSMPERRHRVEEPSR